MRHTMTFKLARILMAPALIVAFIFCGCAGNKGLLESEQAGQTGLLLQYRMPEKQPLQYATSSNFIQDFEASGSRIKVTTVSDLKCTVAGKGLVDRGYKLGVTVDTMDLTITTFRGEIRPDLSGVIGRDFEMRLTPTGDEYDFTGIEDLKYEAIPGRKQGFEAIFQNFFPDLSDQSLSIGDSWKSVDTISTQNDNGDLTLIMESTNRLKGFEKLNGYHCARIESDVKGTLVANTREKDVDLVTTGTITGVDIWYFAPTEGILIKAISSATSEGTVTGSGAKDISMPMQSEISMTTELIR